MLQAQFCMLELCDHFFFFWFSSFAYFMATIFITLYLRSEIAHNENVTDRLKSSILQHQSARYLMHIS